MRTIAVTGAASGIGAATARLLEQSGHRVLGVDLHSATITADLSHAAGRVEAIASIVELSGGELDGLVCAAGVSALGPGGIDREALVISTNFFGAEALLSGLRPLLARTADPAVAVVGSWGQYAAPTSPEVLAACLAGEEDRARALVVDHARTGAERYAYGTSKLALATLVRRLAPTEEWAGANITVNMTVPSVTRTPMTAGRLATAEAEAELLTRFPAPLGRVATAEEQADLLEYLVSGRARYLSGQIICVDGGLDALQRPTAALLPVEPPAPADAERQ